MTRSSPSRPEDLLTRLASGPRGTGTDAIDAARAYCAGELRALGFVVSETPFGYSAFPGRLATPLFGGAVALLALLALRLGPGAPVQSLALLLAGAMTLTVAGAWLARRGVGALPFLRRQGVNLEARRGGAQPRVWLCAHLDSKSQPIPTLVRTAGIVTLGAAWLLALWLAAVTLVGAAPAWWAWSAATLLTLTGALPVVLSVVGNRSAGALDNASGVATVLAAAAELAPEDDVGVLITDAEELGLAGAQAWCRAAAFAAERPVVLNCDGVDDGGDTVLMYSGRPPRALVQAARTAASQSGERLVSRKLPPGVLTDSVAFATHGVSSVTFSRGTWASLARVHSSRDTVDRLRGTGIAPTASLMARTARVILSHGE